MKSVNIHEAKTQFSLLLRLVAEGEEVIIANRGIPVAKLVPLSDKRQLAQGKYRGQIVMADDFDVLPPDIQRAFDGEDDGETGADR